MPIATLHVLLDPTRPIRPEHFRIGQTRTPASQRASRHSLCFCLRRNLDLLPRAAAPVRRTYSLLENLRNAFARDLAHPHDAAPLKERFEQSMQPVKDDPAPFVLHDVDRILQVR